MNKGDHVKLRWTFDGVKDTVVAGTIVSIRVPDSIVWVMWFDNETITQEHIDELEVQA